MQVEQNEYIVSPFQKEKIYSFVGTSYPTHAELLAGKQTVLPNEVLIDLKERGVRIDSDVIAILMDIYEEQELHDEPDPETTALYAALIVGGLLSTARGLVEFQQDALDDAYMQWYISVGFFTSAYIMNQYSGNKHAERVEGFLRNHLPPLYSRQAVQDAYLKGYLKGRVERDKNKMLELLNRQSKEELSGAKRPDMLFFMKLLQGEQILEDAQKRFLYEYEMMTLVTLAEYMKGENQDIVYNHFGVQQCEFIEMLVTEYKMGIYPVGYEFTSDDAISATEEHRGE